MPWISKTEWLDIMQRMEENRAQIWELSSEVVDVRIDNENLRRKIKEYD